MAPSPAQSLYSAFPALKAPQPTQSFYKSTIDPESYTHTFLDFISENPTVFHAVKYFEDRLSEAGYTKLSEKSDWKLEVGGKYWITRNSSGLIAFKVGSGYKPGNGAVIIAGHIDALTAKVKPVSTKPTKQGYVQIGVAQYGGALNQTWFDRDLGIGGRVLVKDSQGRIHERLVKLESVGVIPSIAPHFGIPAEGQANREIRMVPIISLDHSDIETQEYPLAGAATFASTQPRQLVKAIAGELKIQDYDTIVNWELEMFSSQPAQLLGLEKELLMASRLDDKLCVYAAIEALIASTDDSPGLSIAGLFDGEEIGSLLRQGARSNFLPSLMERVIESFASKSTASLLYQTYANSFLLSSDVTHGYNPNYDDVYLKDHTPRLNIGPVVSFDSNYHMTSDGVSSTIINRIAEMTGSKLQVFQIRNDSRSGGTVGPMLSAATGVRALELGIAQLSMHSIRATTGSLDPGLGIKLFHGAYEHFYRVDQELAF